MPAMLELRSLHRKPRARAPMETVATLNGVAGHGLVGDAAAHAASPRHVLLVAAADLAALGVTGPDVRANLVVRGDLHGLASGDVVSFGSLALRITIPCEACRRLDHVRPGLAHEIGLRRGVLARVVGDGTASPGDRGHVLPRALPALAVDWKARILSILTRMPTDRVITYAALARAAGVQSTYCRALPAVLRALAARGASIDRVLPDRAAPLDAPRWDASSLYAAEERALLHDR